MPPLEVGLGTGLESVLQRVAAGGLGRLTAHMERGVAPALGQPEGEVPHRRGLAELTRGVDHEVELLVDVPLHAGKASLRREHVVHSRCAWSRGVEEPFHPQDTMPQPRAAGRSLSLAFRKVRRTPTPSARGVPPCRRGRLGSVTGPVPQLVVMD